MHEVDGAWLERWLALLARHVERASAAGVRAALASMPVTPEREPAQARPIAAR
jgi:hypothetical protein